MNVYNNFADMFDMGRRSIMCDYSYNIDELYVYFCEKFHALFIHDTDYITRSIWTREVYQHDSIMGILYDLIVRLYYNNSDLRFSVFVSYCVI